jgi:hypothetical protein
MKAYQMLTLGFRIHPERYALSTLPGDAPYPAWVRGRFSSMSRTQRELTVVSEQGTAPPGVTTKRDFRCLEIDGAFTLDAVGVVAAASEPLARAGISLFLISVWSTDFLLIPDGSLDRGVAALRHAGHAVSMTPEAEQ